ncbi:MAG: hypothetical protein LBM77_03090 [Spirochaetaceae bacterium]|jgi:hypothetical protein|nr:hypothetical protein [Spirochaetaceae bacterium]
MGTYDFGAVRQKDMRSMLGIKGRVTVRVLGEDGRVRRYRANLLQKIFGLPGKAMQSVHHNVVTRQGEAIIVDAMDSYPDLVKPERDSGYMQIGSGWNGKNTKHQKRCNKPIAIKEFSTSPTVWYYLDDEDDDGEEPNLVRYRATFKQGELVANGINECCILNGNDDEALSFAYAQITPALNVAKNDMLDIVWEIQILGQ